MNVMQCAAVLTVLGWALAIPSRAQQEEPTPIPIRVVVITTFEIGKDTGDTPGEFQHWVENFPLPKTIPFPQGYHHLRYNPDLQVLGMVTGEGKSHAAASIMGLGMDPRFDLTQAYWLVAGIAGVDPQQASVASCAWAHYIVDGDLGYEIDAREIPPDWSTGYVPLGRSIPYQSPAPPFNSLNGHQVFELNGALVDWAYRLTAHTLLPDDATLQQVRANYPGYPNALNPPFVLKGDDLAADTFWVGDLLNRWAEQWVSYWTVNKGTFVMSDFEDSGVLQALTFLAQAGRADRHRVLVLRSASDYTVQGQGQSPAQFLAGENSGGLSGYIEALNNVYQVGSTVVKELSAHWETYGGHLPSPPAK